MPDLLSSWDRTLKLRATQNGGDVEASPQFDLPPSKIESLVDGGTRGSEHALRAKPEDGREQHERQLKELQEAYGEAMLELRARKKIRRPCCACFSALT